VRFVAAVSEVGDVLMMGHIGFRDEGNPEGLKIHHVADEFDDLMGLGETDAFGTGFGP
jgi:hypothetical protein